MKPGIDESYDLISSSLWKTQLAWCHCCKKESAVNQSMLRNVLIQVDIFHINNSCQINKRILQSNYRAHEGRERLGSEILTGINPSNWWAGWILASRKASLAICLPHSLQEDRELFAYSTFHGLCAGFASVAILLGSQRKINYQRPDNKTKKK